MRILRPLKLLGFLVGFSPFLLGGCGGSSSPTTPASLPVSVEGLDGATGVAVDASFSFGFAKAVSTPSVSTSTFFIVATPTANIAVGPKAALDTSICNSANALSASVSCESVLSCTLDPTNNLSNSTQYTICLTTDIDYTDGTSFEGYMATFTTVAASASCTAPTCSSIQALILASNLTGVRPSTSFTTVTMPEFTSCTSTPTYSMTGLPSSMAFDASSRALSLASGSTTIASTDATSAITATYTATIGSTATSVECTLNDMDGDTVIDHTEYSLSEVPLLRDGFGDIALTSSTVSLYRPTIGSAKSLSTGIIKATEGMNLNDAADATADFDGDGETNLAEITASTNIFVAESTGIFASAVNYSVGGRPNATSGDIDGDGDIDLLATNSNSSDNTVSILLGSGNGTFNVSSTLSVNNKPNIAMVADFDGGGLTDDLAIRHRTSSNNVLLRLVSNGSVTSTTSYSISDGDGAGTAADLDGDGDIDVATSNSNSNNVSVLLNSGDGTFSSAANYSAGAGTIIPIAGDFDSDGDLDLAVTNTGGNNISVLLGRGDGAFETAVNYGVGVSPVGIIAGDFDNDGNLDLAVANVVDNNVSVLLGVGDGTFASAVNYSAGAGTGVPATADLDGDGDLDLATANGIGPGASIAPAKQNVRFGRGIFHC